VSFGELEARCQTALAETDYRTLKPRRRTWPVAGTQISTASRLVRPRWVPSGRKEKPLTGTRPMNGVTTYAATHPATGADRLYCNRLNGRAINCAPRQTLPHFCQFSAIAGSTRYRSTSRQTLLFSIRCRYRQGNGRPFATESDFPQFLGCVSALSSNAQAASSHEVPPREVDSRRRRQ
jgi:hypothetical protein